MMFGTVSCTQGVDTFAASKLREAHPDVQRWVPCRTSAFCRPWGANTYKPFNIGLGALSYWLLNSPEFARLTPQDTAT